MAKVIETDVGVLVIHAEVVSEGDRATAKENRWMSEVRIGDGSTVLVVGPAIEKRVDLVVGYGGQEMYLFSAPEDRTKVMPLHQHKVEGLQTGDTILYQVKADSQPVEMTFTAK